MYTTVNFSSILTHCPNTGPRQFDTPARILRQLNTPTGTTRRHILNKKRKLMYNFGDVTFLSSRWKWIYGI